MKSTETAESRKENSSMETAESRKENSSAETVKQTKHSPLKVWGFVILALLLAATLGLAVYRVFFAAEEKNTTPLSTVTTQYPQTGSIEIETSLVGTRMPGDVYYALAMTSAKVTKVYVSVGDRVKKGDKICELDNQKQIDAAKITMDSAELQVKSVEDSIELAETNLKRMEALYATGDISAQSYEQVKSSYDQAVASLDAARLQYDGAKLQYDTQVEFATVTAPGDGVIESANMTENAYVTASTAVAVISGSGDATITFNITDRLLSGVHAGDPVRVEKQGSEYSGTVTEVSQMPGQTTGLYEVKADIEDGGAIPTGASAKVYFISEKTADAVLVPTGAVYHDGGKTYVYTVSYEDAADVSANNNMILEGNRAASVHKKEVATGLSDPENTEITEGITTGDEVIVTWTAQLYEGASVQVSGGAAK